MHEALCRPSSTTLDIVHAEDGPPITQRTSGLNLEAARAGKILRLAVNIPPRYLKSIIVSVAYVAWLLGHDPTTKIICASYNEDLAAWLGRMCLQVMQAEWYRTLFPRTRLASDRPSAEFFETTVGGYRVA